MKLGDGRFDFYTKRYNTRGMVDLTFAQGGMKLGDGRFDSCRGRYETRGW